MWFCSDLSCNYGDDPFHFLQEMKKPITFVYILLPQISTILTTDNTNET